jgi:hypothetical protein
MDQIAPELFSPSLLLLTWLGPAQNIRAYMQLNKSLGHVARQIPVAAGHWRCVHSRPARLDLETLFCFFNFPSLSTITSQVELSSPSHHFQGLARRRKIVR